MTSHYDLSSNKVERLWRSAINTCSVSLRKGGTDQQKRTASSGNTLGQNPLRIRSRWRKWKTLWKKLWKKREK